MTTRYCVRHQLGLCPEQDPAQRAEPLLLTDAEGHTLELRFECARCGMAVFLRDRQAELAAPCGGARAPRAARRRSPAERRPRANRRGR